MHPLPNQKRSTWSGILTSIRWHPKPKAKPKANPTPLESYPHQEPNNYPHRNEQYVCAMSHARDLRAEKAFPNRRRAAAGKL